MMKFLSLGLLLWPCFSLAADRLISNFNYVVTPGASVGELRAVARGSEAVSGVSTLHLGVSGGQVQLLGIDSRTMESGYTAVHDRIFADLTGEFRRTPWALDSNQDLWLPYFSKTDGMFVQPLGLVRLDAGGFDYHTLAADTLVLSDSLARDPLNRTVTALTPAGNFWWLAQAASGLVRWNAGNGNGERWLLDFKNARLQLAAEVDSVLATLHAPIYGLAASGDSLWLGSAKGLWLRLADGSLRRSGNAALDSGRVTGIWAGGSPLQLWVETSRRNGMRTEGSLWRSLDRGKTFAQVIPAYDSLDLTVSHAAFLGNEAWLAVQRTEGSLTGLLRVGPAGPIPWTDSLPSDAQPGASPFVWGLDAGVTDRDAYIVSVCAFPLQDQLTGLAVATDGGGVAVSADSGRTWKSILNQVAVKKDLAQIRLVPSVLRFQGSTALVAYSLSQNAKVTIEVFSYDMKKVRTIVRNASRLSDPVRSSDPRTDVWDGTDDAGRPVAMGTYYVKVTDNNGHTGWGKVMTMGGQR